MHNSDPETVGKSMIDVENVEAYSARLPTIAKIYSPDETLLGELATPKNSIVMTDS
jgi:hypothetical protein